MSYVFDSSSIFRAIIENRVDKLVDGYTDILAKYELGNIIWKNYYLKNKISSDEYTILYRMVSKTLGLLKILMMDGYEEEILNIAAKLGITFYDAVYVYHSIRLDIPLVTEDKKLVAKVQNHIKTFTLDKINI